MTKLDEQKEQIKRVTNEIKETWSHQTLPRILNAWPINTKNVATSTSIYTVTHTQSTEP
jgi:hypothetical protein